MRTWQRLKQKPDLWAQYRLRERVIDTIRRFFKERDFAEVQTPLLLPVPSCEPNLEVFETELRTAGELKRRAFLSMSPEFAIKKLLAAGIGNCFEITRSFRNEEETAAGHNAEFTILEWYRTQADYQAIMGDTEELITQVLKLRQSDLNKWQYQGEVYNLSRPWLRFPVAEVFEKYAGINLETLTGDRELVETAKKKGYQTEINTTWEQVFYQIYFNEVEPQLLKMGRPFFLTDYPVQQAALAKRKTDEPRLAERFEVFAAGVELGNCFSELTDWQEQEARFRKELRDRDRDGKIKYPMDVELIEALKSGMPETAGMAMGVDRLIMLTGDLPSVAETMFFPTKELFDL